MYVCNCSPAYYLSAYPLEKPLIIVPNAAEVAPPWRDRSIVGPKLRLVELSAFVERQQEGESVRSHSTVMIILALDIGGYWLNSAILRTVLWQQEVHLACNSPSTAV